ncbi:MAG: fumarate hydratase [Spirochaetaceae bacterium]|jgi:fumarate hydratase subunit alpha|nr:fumarate hydratase [Spirochaetaceae bacterium]
MARILDTQSVVDVVAALVKKACCELDGGYVAALREARDREESPYGREVLQTLADNAEYAAKEGLACCQDTGSCAVFMEIGQEVSWQGAPLADMVDEGVRRGYTGAYLRKSMVRDPIDRVNSGDNTPAILHTDIVPGAAVSVTVLPKGGGCENMGVFTTLLPSAGEAGLIDFVVKTVEQAGGKSCPPLTVGVGAGGTMDYCCLLAKRALLRPHGSRSPAPRYARLEAELLERINQTGIGPMGLGGRITALDVRIEQYPCHITAFPIAVSLQCHAARIARAEI